MNGCYLVPPVSEADWGDEDGYLHHASNMALQERDISRLKSLFHLRLQNRRTQPASSSSER